ASEDDLEWTNGKFFVKGSPEKAKTIQEIAFAAYTNHPAGMEAGLEAVDYYDPPNLTFPFGSYICVVDIDRGTGEVHVRRFVAVDAPWHLGVRNIDIPMTPPKIWAILHEKGVTA